MITQEYLKSILHYNQNNGAFHWIAVNFDNQVKKYMVAGSFHKQGHLIICIDGTQYHAHRLAHFYMTGAMPDKYIDHINGIRHDNRWINLRHVTPEINSKNAKKRKDNKY